jgi:hypothetical protein
MIPLAKKRPPVRTGGPSHPEKNPLTPEKGGYWLLVIGEAG